MLTYLSRRSFLLTSAGAALLGSQDLTSVDHLNVPPGALQPQALIDSKGILHLIYLYGDPSAADVGYVRKAVSDSKFSVPIRVNSHPGSAVALGTVRGAHLAVGKSDRIHVAWNGSLTAQPKGPRNSAPMLYSRLNDRKDRFDPQKNVITTASGLDGGGALAADTLGNVFVAWHAQGQEHGEPIIGEEHRRVWLARSSDGGSTFNAEIQVSPAETGACGCCGIGAISDAAGHLYLLYRSAQETVHRDMYLLISRNAGKSFQAVDLHPWTIGACPMSTVSLATVDGRVLLSWESAQQVYFAEVDARTLKLSAPVAAPGESNNRKHPSVAIGQNGETLLAWTEGTGWKKGGSLAWQRFDRSGKPVGPIGGSAGLPPWDFAAAIQMKGRFIVIS